MSASASKSGATVDTSRGSTRVEELARRGRSFTGGVRPDPQTIGAWAGGLVVIAVVAFRFGMIPGAQLIHLHNWSAVAGYAECALDQGDLIVRLCSRMGYPAGAYAFEDMVPKTLSMWVSVVTGSDAFLAYQAIGVLFIALGVIGCVGISRLLSGRTWPGLLAAAAYLMSPGVGSSPGLMKVGFGCFLLPFAFWLGIRTFLWAADSWARQGVFATLTFATGLILVNVWGYAFLYYVFLLGAMLTIWVASAVVARRQWMSLGLLVAALGGFALTAVTQLALWPDSATGGAPMEFIRGTSVDVLGLVIPGDGNSLWASMGLTTEDLGIAGPLFIGGAPFIGLFSATLFVIALVRRRSEDEAIPSTARHRDARVLTVALTVAAVGTIVMIMGPSLRFNDPWPADTESLTFSSRQMPAEEATMSFPWDDLYETRGLSLARVVWRWQIPMRLVLSIGAALGIAAVAHLSRGRRWIPAVSVLLAVLMVLEVTNPRSLGDGRSYWGRQQAIDDFRTSVLDPYDAQLQDGALVLYLPSGNDFLATATGPLLRVIEYNAPGDKNRAIARAAYPDLVRTTMRSYGTENFDPDSLRALLSEGHVDAIALNFWSLHRATYQWPPSSATYERWSTFASESVSQIRDRCEVSELEYAYIVSVCS